MSTRYCIEMNEAKYILFKTLKFCVTDFYWVHLELSHSYQWILDYQILLNARQVGTSRGTTINDLGRGPEENEKKIIPEVLQEKEIFIQKGFPGKNKFISKISSGSPTDNLWSSPRL